MRTPKMFKPCFTFGVPSVSSVPDAISIIENNELIITLADTLREWPGVTGVSDADWADGSRPAGTPDTPHDFDGVSAMLKNNLLNNKEELNWDTQGTPDTLDNPSYQKLLPDTGSVPEGLSEIEAQLWQAIAAEPGLSRVQLCKRTGVSVDAFDASTPALCGRLLVWPDFARYGGWVTAQQVKEDQL